jgi:hypothetical protein
MGNVSRHRGFESVSGNVSKSYLITLSDVATALCAVRERGLRMPCYDAPQGRGYSVMQRLLVNSWRDIFANTNG